MSSSWNSLQCAYGFSKECAHPEDGILVLVEMEKETEKLISQKASEHMKTLSELAEAQNE